MLNLPDPLTMNAYLHDRITLSRAMGAVLETFDESTALLSAPLAPNINPPRDCTWGQRLLFAP
jgi:hypothetical protein